MVLHFGPDWTVLFSDHARGLKIRLMFLVFCPTVILIWRKFFKISLYLQLTRAYFAFLEVLFNSHIVFILNLDTNTFMHIVGSLESGLKGLDANISAQVWNSQYLGFMQIFLLNPFPFLSFPVSCIPTSLLMFIILYSLSTSAFT